MTDKMDLPLDDIVKMNKTSGGGKKRTRMFRSHGNRGVSGSGGLGGRGGKARFGRGGALRALPHQMHANAEVTNKILVSNLANTVSDEDVRELFHEFGQIRYSALHHDTRGRR